VTITGLLYTIPSLALLILLPSVTGWYSFTSETNLIVALTIYAVAILVRSVADGLDSVDPGVRQASTAVGYGSFRRFWAVDFPLAGPVTLAGLRVTAASTISLATVGILVGITNLGYLFTNGLQRRIIPEVLAGVVAVVVLALVVDLLLVLAGRALMPWTRRVPTPRARRSPAIPAGAGA
jgi:osmoprotectant transport system permease protein